MLPTIEGFCKPSNLADKFFFTVIHYKYR